VAEQTASPLTDVIRSVKVAMREGVDPYLLAGALLEAIVQTLASGVPAERREATELALVTMLQQRLGHSAKRMNGAAPCSSAPENS
jgi:hypothetical protein